MFWNKNIFSVYLNTMFFNSKRYTALLQTRCYWFCLSSVVVKKLTVTLKYKARHGAITSIYACYSTMWFQCQYLMPKKGLIGVHVVVKMEFIMKFEIQKSYTNLSYIKEFSRTKEVASIWSCKTYTIPIRLNLTPE